MRLRQLPLLTLALALPAFADGRIEINQARALAGGITPGDAPDFPVTLDQGGSYVLTSNLLLPNVNTHGIVVEADDVADGFTFSNVDLDEQIGDRATLDTFNDVRGYVDQGRSLLLLLILVPALNNV